MENLDALSVFFIINERPRRVKSTANPHNNTHLRAVKKRCCKLQSEQQDGAVSPSCVLADF